MAKTSYYFYCIALICLVIKAGSASQAHAEIVREGVHPVYRVRDEGESLSLVSLRLYGEFRYWRELAAANHLRRPYRLVVGQKLVITTPPTLTDAQGNQVVLHYWRAKMGLIGENGNGVAGDEYAPPPSRAHTQEAYLQAMHQSVGTGAKESKEVREAREAKEGAWEATLAQPSTAEELLAQGRAQFDAHQFETALQLFRQSRDGDPDLIAPRLYEVRTLRALARNDEADQAAKALLARKPALARVRSFQKLLHPEGQTP